MIEYDTIYLFETGFLSEANISYFWFINDTNYGSSNDSSFEYSFNLPSKSILEAFVYAKIPIPNHSAHHNNEYSGATLGSKNHTQWRHPSVSSAFIAKNARFQTTIEAKIPMNNLVHKGKTLSASKDIYR